MKGRMSVKGLCPWRGVDEKGKRTPGGEKTHKNRLVACHQNRGGKKSDK